MKKTILLLLLIAAAVNTYAYHFSSVCGTGQTLYYNITSDSTVVVTYPGNYGRANLNMYSFGVRLTDPYCDYEYYMSYAGATYYIKSNTHVKPAGKLRLPQQVQNNGNTYSVTGINDYAFFECSDLILIVPEGMTIGNQALYGVTYYYLSDLYYYDSLYYEDSAMNRVIEYDDSVRHVVFPNTVTSIVSRLFFNDTLLQSITFHNDNEVTNIPSCTFYGCSGIHKLVIPDNVNTIGYKAFYGCTGIDSLYIGSGVNTIDEKAFSGCAGLRYMHYNAKNLNSGLFWGSDSPFNSIYII